MKKSKNEEQKVSAPTGGIFHLLLVSGLLAWIINLIVNLVQFIIVLFVSQSSLIYSLVFFAISVIGEILFLRKK